MTHPDEAVADRRGQDDQGLTSAEALELLDRHGRNEVPVPRRRGVVWRAGRQLRDPMLLLLLGAAVLTVWTGDYADATIIALVIVLNTTVGVVQELRAERAITALRAMAAPQARVRRDGRDVLVPAESVVPGDLLQVEPGDIVAADAVVLEQHQLQTDDSALTGESVAVFKGAGDDLFGGTTVTRGRGRARVVRTGSQSAHGRIATMVTTARPGPTPLQQRLTHLGRQLTVAAVTVSALVMVLSLLRGVPLMESVLTGVSLAVAAVPESLPAVLTLSLALGAHRMARHAAIARELRAVETLGSVTLLATDKTGTLTENRMVVEHVWTPEGEYDVTGAGYSPDGSIHRHDRQPAGPALQRLLRDVVLCNDADTEPDPRRAGEWRAIGDPTEAALVVLARRAGVDTDRVRAGAPRVHEVPFDSQRAWMATEHQAGDQRTVVCKGAPDILLGSVVPADGNLPAARRWAAEHAADGFRVLAVTETDAALADRLPERMRLVGMVAMTDPPRRDLKPVLRTLHDAGIAVVVMTGDHPATAAAVARRVGLLSVDGHEEVRTGAAAAADGTVPVADLDGVRVFARVQPEHKLALVRAWQQSGEVVAVTGDGVNDGPALRLADIGVAMGGGTEVARQAADLILTDDRLETVVHAVEEGRRIYDNLVRFLGYALGGGLAEVLFMLLAPLFGFVVPLLPGQILWINMLTHGLPGVALGAEPVSSDAMKRPPIPRRARVIDRPLALRIAVTGVMIATVTMAAALLSRGHADWRSSAFLVLGLSQLGVALAIRQRGAASANPFLSAAVAAAVLLQAAGVLLPPLRQLLETEALPADTWIQCLLLSTLPGLMLWLGRRHDLLPWNSPAFGRWLEHDRPSRSSQDESADVVGTGPPTGTGVVVRPRDAEDHDISPPRP